MPGRGPTWTNNEIKLLLKLKDEGLRYDEISLKFRQTRGCYHRSACALQQRYSIVTRKRKRLVNLPTRKRVPRLESISWNQSVQLHVEEERETDNEYEQSRNSRKNKQNVTNQQEITNDEGAEETEDEESRDEALSTNVQSDAIGESHRDRNLKPSEPEIVDLTSDVECDSEVHTDPIKLPSTRSRKRRRSMDQMKMEPMAQKVRRIMKERRRESQSADSTHSNNGVKAGSDDVARVPLSSIPKCLTKTSKKMQTKGGNSDEETTCNSMDKDCGGKGIDEKGSYPSEKDMHWRNWNKDDTFAWLTQIGFEDGVDYAAILGKSWMESDVDGETLPELNMDHLKTLGLTKILYRIKLLKAIKKLTDPDD